MKKDRNLIFLISEKSRMKIKDVSGLLRKSLQRIKYSMRVLEKEELIELPHCIFDYSYFGLLVFRIYFKGGYITEEDREQIIETLKKNSYIISIYELSGEYDLVIEMASPNPSRFNKEIKKVINELPTLNNFNVILNLVTHIYPRTYLLKNDPLMGYSEQEIIIGGDREVMSFSENELSVIQAFLETPKIRWSRLARKTGLNVKTAMKIYRSLHDRNVIRAFKYNVNCQKMGFFSFRLFLNLHNLSLAREKTLLRFMLARKEVVQVNKTVGDWDIEIDIESIDKSRIRQIMIELRMKFKDIIKNFKMIEFYNHYKKDYLPVFYFEESGEDGG